MEFANNTLHDLVRPTNTLEYYWGYTFDNYSERLLTTVGTFAIHELAYLLFFVPFFFVDFIPSLQKYKLQKNVVNNTQYTWRAYKKVLITHLLVQLPMMLMFHDVYMKQLGLSVSLPLPSWGHTISVCILSFIIEDFYFYWVHRLLHHPALYKHIHKVHHDYAAPFGFAAEYAHPIETMVLGVGTVIGPLVLTRHYFTVLVWLIVRLFQTVEAHCGYDFPWSPRHFIPFWGGAEFHDYHHETFSGNYASSFIVWDWVFGTDVKYRERKMNKKIQ
jgi:methylsterol monooxygenase